MAPNDKLMFYRYLDKARVYFEYGSGGSTAQAARRVEKIYSVESCHEWHSKLKELPGNIDFIYSNMNTKPNTFGQPGPGCTLAQKQAYRDIPKLRTPPERGVLNFGMSG